MPRQYITNARIYTLNPDQPIADSICIRNGRIASIGQAQDVIPRKTTGLEVLDLRGQTVLPSFTDAHIHLLAYGSSLDRVNCETDSRAICLEQVINSVQASEPGKWILGHGWNHNVWADGMGSCADLDPFSADNPVYLTHKSLHSAWVNSAALRAAGIKDDTPDPAGGKIIRDSGGEPTGILLESAMSLVERVIPEPTPQQNISSIQAAQRALNRLGITSVHDFDIWPCYSALSFLSDNQALTIRVVKNIPSNVLDKALDRGLKSADGDDFVRIGWLKIFADGALGPQTAAMFSPYENSSSHGMLFLDKQDILSIGTRAMKAGISLAVHAIGDRANHEVLSGYAQLASDGLFGNCQLAPRIEHVQLISPADVKSFSKIGITPSMQPVHAVSDRFMADVHWGNRCTHAYAWNTLLQENAALVFGSDAPVEDPNPFLGLFAATTRKTLTKDGYTDSWYPQQCLSIHQALEAYIKTPPKISGWGHQLGSLRPGYLADLVVLPVDIMREPSDVLHDCLPTMTMLSGRWVFVEKT